MNKVYLSAIFALFWLVCSCSNQKTQPDVTPWGTPIGEEDYSNNSNQTKGFTYRIQWRINHADYQWS